MGWMKILALVIIVFWAIGFPIALLWLMAIRARKLGEAIYAEFSKAGERIQRGPERAQYEGTSKRYGFIRNTGVIAVSTSRLVFRPLFGKPIDIASHQIKALPLEGRSRRRGFGKQESLSVVLNDGDWVEFTVREAKPFRAALERSGSVS